MGKKRKAPKSDKNGVFYSGIYKPRPDETKSKSMTAAEIDAAIKSLEALEGLGLPSKGSKGKAKQETQLEPIRKQSTIREWFAGYRNILAESIQPHIVRDESPQLGYHYKPLPELGRPWLRLADNLVPEVREAVLDAFDAISAIRTLEHHVGADDSLTGDLAWVIQRAYNLGRAVERMQVRQFEPLVATAKAQRATIEKINAEKRNKSGNLKQQALDAIEKAKKEHSKRADDSDFIKEQAAKALGIKKRALNTRLSK